MNMSEFYSDFWLRYQTDGAPRKMSINAYCISEGVEYRNFIKWYRDNKKRIRESEMDEIRVSALAVTGTPFSAVSSPVTISPIECNSENPNVFCFRLKLRNGIEINQENSNLDKVICLLQSLRSLC